MIMKTTRFVTMVSVLVSFGTLTLLNSCNKQDTGSLNQNGLSDKQPELSIEDHSVLKKIQKFKQKVRQINENPHLKSGETMSVDSAKWYLDAAFNFTYAFTEESFTDFNTDTFSIVLSKSNGMINLDDISAAFFELKEKTLIIYNETQGVQKELYVSALETTENTSDQVILKSTATIGARNESTPPGIGEWGPFEEGDNWMYGEKLGDCNGNYIYIMDAATEIENATNTFRYKYIRDNGPGWFAYYTEPSVEVSVTLFEKPPSFQNIFRNPNDPTIDNYRDYFLMYQRKDPQNGLVVQTCIPWEDMNFYYHGTHMVIYHIIQENDDVFGVASNLTFYHCTMEGIGTGAYIDDPDYVHHKLKVVYKTRHISDITERTSINE